MRDKWGPGIIRLATSGNGIRDGGNEEIAVPRLEPAIRSVISSQEQWTPWHEASWEMRAERTWRRYRERIRTVAET